MHRMLHRGLSPVPTVIRTHGGLNAWQTQLGVVNAAGLIVLF